MSYKGVIKNNSILLKDPIDIPEGTEIEIELVPRHPLLKVFGICKNDDEWDDILEKIYNEREKNFGREVKI